MRKRLLSILLLCCMVLTLLPTTALAEEAAPAFDLATDLADIKIPNDLVTCVCTKANETKQYGQLTNGFSATKVAKEGNVWTVLISVKPDVYMAQFNKDTGSTHSPDGDHSNDFTTPIQFKLKYEENKWVLEGEMPKDKTLHFTCNGGHATQNPPVFDLTKDLAGITIPADLVTCTCTKANETKQYGQLTNGFSATKVAKEGNVWTVLISVKPDVYMAQFNKDTGSTHSPDGDHSNDFTTPIQFKLKYEENKWVLEGEMPQNKTLHFTCSGGHVYQGDIPVISLRTRTATEILVTENSAWEYSIDNGATWQRSCLFKDLIPGTEYTIIARVRETATHKPSANSAPLNVTTMHIEISDELKKQLRAVASGYEGEYDGMEHGAVIVDDTKLPPGWTIAGYTTDEGSSFGNSIPKIKDAGTLRVGVKFVHPDYFMNITSYYTAEVTPKPLTNDMIANIPNQLYTGQPIHPKPEIKHGDMVLVEGTDFTYSYDTNTSTEQGGKVTITGKGNYKGMASKSFNIVNEITEITEDDLKDLEIPTLVTVKCTTTNSSKEYGRIPGGFDLSKKPYMENGVWKAIVQLNLPAYKAKYDADTKKTHEIADLGGNLVTTFTLKYVNDKWELDGTFPNVIILVKCDGQHPQTPPYPTEENVSGLGDQIVAVLCNNVPTGQQSGKYYGLIGGGFTSTAPTLNADKVYESTITLIPSVYCNQFSGDTGIMHKVLSAQTTDGLKFVVKYDSSTKMWKPAEEVKQMAIWVTCDKHETPTPEMPMYPMADNISGLGDQIVAVLCNNVPTGQQSGKYYGLIGGGFTSTAPTLNADKVYESTITLIPSVYCNQFSGDTGIMHKVLSAQTTDGLKFVVKYDSSTKMWKPAEEVKQMAIWVTCDKHETDTPVPTEFTITFKGNGGTPSVTSMTTIDQKLPELPTATHSGRYSFDGWYSAASGGTKITTATVFYENTTVYAHWTYIGGGGSSGGGGGYTYHTIRAISGLNGSISPSGWTSVRHGWDQTFTITPDKGYAVAKVLVDGKSVGSVKSYTFKNVTKDHTIEVVFMKANGNPQTGVFVDVAEGSYYEEAVDWAVKNGITTGTGNNYFTPDGICTRAQAVTFLWRVAGSPTPKTEAMPFEDVLNGSYYYEAVLWAVENGITVGTSATTFSPELTCSRAHIVTFLWRAANSPSAKTANPFTDVAADAYYIDAVLWAVKHKITVGTTLSTFSPDEGCTRAQIVTFLYRAHSK